MPQEYSVQFNFQDNILELKGKLLDLRKSFADLQQQIAASWKAGIPEIQDVSLNMSQIGQQAALLNKNLGAVFERAAQSAGRFAQQLEYAAMVPQKIKLQTVVNMIKSIDTVTAQVTTAMELLSMAMSGVPEKNRKVFEAYIKSGQESIATLEQMRASLEQTRETMESQLNTINAVTKATNEAKLAQQRAALEAKLAAQERAAALSKEKAEQQGLADQWKRTTADIGAAQTKMASTQRTAFAELSQQQRGTWMLWTNVGKSMQGVMAFSSAMRQSLMGVAMSFMFATSESVAFVTAGALLGGMIGTVSAALKTLSGIIRSVFSAALSLAQSAISALLNILGSAANAFVEFGKKFADAFSRTRETVLANQESLGLFYRDLQAGARITQDSMAIAENYRFALDDTQKAIYELSKAYLYNAQNMQAVIALAALNRTNLEDAAKAYINAIGLTKAHTESLRDWGIIIGRADEGLNRLQVTQMVNNAIMSQAGDAVSKYVQTVTASMNKLEAAVQEVLAVVMIPLWQALSPVIGEIANQIFAFVDYIRGIDFSPITSALRNFAGIIALAGDAIRAYFGPALEAIINRVGTLFSALTDKIYEFVESADFDRIVSSLANIASVISTAVLGAITGLSIGLASIPIDLDDIIRKFSELSESGNLSFSNITTIVARETAEWGTKILGFVKLAIEALKVLADAIKEVFNAATGLLALLSAPAAGFTAAPMKAISELYETITGKETALTNALSVPFDVFADRVKNIPGLGDWAKIYFRIENIANSIDKVNADAERAGKRAAENASNFFDSLAQITTKLSGARNEADNLRRSFDQSTLSASQLAGSMEYLPEKTKARTNEVINEVKSALQAWRNLIEEQFKPTMEFDFQNWMDNMVTAYDKMGRRFGEETGFFRKDVWDENFRRILDIVNRGMESPWAQMFIPPEDVIAKGNDAVRAWAAQLAHEFQLGLHPELINWDAFIESLRETVSAKANWQAIIQEGMARATEAGLSVSSAEVQQALAMMLSPQAQALLTSLDMAMTAFDAKAQELDWTTPLTSAITTDVANNYELIKSTGRLYTNAIVDGILTGFSEGSDEIAKQLLPIIEGILRKALSQKRATEKPAEEQIPQ